MDGIRISPDRNLRFVCAQPAIKYYAWQVEVMLNNFAAMGVNLNNVDIVCWKVNGEIPEDWSKLANGYPARFFFYDDTRKTRNYISSIRPNILKQHWANHPHLESEAIFYHDCDIIFTKPIGEWISQEIINDQIWYGSDTRWYIAHSYIKGKGQEVMDLMCEIMHMPEEVIEKNELNAIGAQYLMKGIDANYWERVERDCEELFQKVTLLNTMIKANKPEYHEIQIWCSDMWAVLWGGWRLGYQTRCLPEFDFSWGTSHEGDYHKMNIMHNAGVTGPHQGLFYKAEYQNEYPYAKELNVKEETASWHYWDWVKKTAEKSVLI
jgi:hypothetical protein